MIGLWVAGGIITLCGALSLGELAAALPESGGFYAYLRESWGRPTAFLFGWAELILIRASALGGIAIVFGEYLLRSLGVDPLTHWLAARTLAAGAIAFASIANILGANVGKGNLVSGGGNLMGRAQPSLNRAVTRWGAGRRAGATTIRR